MSEEQDPSQTLDAVVNELKEQGIDPNQKDIGLGDIIHATLQKIGVSEETVQKWFGIKECGCKARQKFLNGALSFLRK